MSTIRKTRRKRLDLGCAGLSLSPDEFDSIVAVDERFRYELIRGVIVVSRLPSVAEGEPNDELGSLLREYKRNHPQGASLDTTLPERYIYSGDNRRRADRLVWTGLGRVPDLEVDLPTIAVEFVSQSKRDWLRDYEEKRVEYLALGIREYWVIDRFARTMTVFRADAADLVVPAEGTYRTPLLPGFELPLSALLKVADRWPKPSRRKPRAEGEPG